MAAQQGVGTDGADHVGTPRLNADVRRLERDRVVSERICWAVITALHGRVTTVTQTFNLGPPGDPSTKRSEEQNSLSDRDLVRPLLERFELSQIDAAIRWLRLGEYIAETRWGMTGLWVHALTEKGAQTVQSGGFTEQERRLFYGQTRPHQIFLAHQFRSDEAELVRTLNDVILRPAGYTVVDGQAEGLEEFRDAILSKIRESQFFLALLTHRARLERGRFVSSVWLYQEIGAAVAMGKRPLLLVEEGMDEHYAGELQKTYEYVPFNRGSCLDAFQAVPRRFEAELDRRAVPLPGVDRGSRAV